MALKAELQAGQTLHLEQQGEQTLIQLQGGNQRQRALVRTGAWRSAPKLYQADEGSVLELHADQPVFYAFDEGQLHSLTTVPELAGEQVIEWQDVPDGTADEGGLEPMKPMEPMKAMEPMKPM